MATHQGGRLAPSFSFCPSITVIVDIPFMKPAERSIQKAIDLFFSPITRDFCYGSRFYYRWNWSQVPRGTPKPADIEVIFRDFLLILLHNVVFHEVRRVRHLPLDPLKGVVVDGKLLCRSMGDFNPGRGEDILRYATRELIEEDVEMRNPSFLKFESPKIFEGGAEEAAADLEPGLKVFFDLKPINGFLFVVCQNKLRLKQITGIITEMG